MKFRDLKIGDQFISESYLHTCIKKSNYHALTEYGNTLFDEDDEVIPHSDLYAVQLMTPPTGEIFKLKPIITQAK